ncbi:DExH-box ATP-dependent RNA helicase DExH1 [Porphyridium purpureum]|uniref:RNA helicase n=1 Tax=Porphyridium purpureum TaxID=35688 RepID=A0A5J4Z3R7_PORPP|nr:DExH-box ATP-dependent RNA helicase DExH1 [Porphyridium purpureum]|eukprot:POR7255..scf295_1
MFTFVRSVLLPRNRGAGGARAIEALGRFWSRHASRSPALISISAPSCRKLSATRRVSCAQDEGQRVHSDSDQQLGTSGVSLEDFRAALPAQDNENDTQHENETRSEEADTMDRGYRNDGKDREKFSGCFKCRSNNNPNMHTHKVWECTEASSPKAPMSPESRAKRDAERKRKFMQRKLRDPNPERLELSVGTVDEILLCVKDATATTPHRKHVEARLNAVAELAMDSDGANLSRADAADDSGHAGMPVESWEELVDDVQEHEIEDWEKDHNIVHEDAKPRRARRGRPAKIPKHMMEQRMRLPAWKQQTQVVEAVRNNQVVVISGETGCGKTTQVPQFLLDAFMDAGELSEGQIVCTQPRRISAVSVADRVASERGEDVGQTVGFKIRLESSTSANTRLLFCTTGVLLRMLQTDKSLGEVSIIVVDEIHERSLETDFLLIVLRDLLSKRRDLRVVLMSATLNAELFADYFGGAPLVHIPGFTYPVQELFLEDCIELTGYHFEDPQRALEQQKSRGKRVPNAKERKTRLRQRDVKAEREMVLERLRDRQNGNWSHDTERTAGSGSESPNIVSVSSYSERTVKSLLNSFYPSSDAVPHELVEKLLVLIDDQLGQGAVLVFLPGWDDITKLYELLTGNSSRFGDTQKYKIFPLHSSMPTDNQREIFKRPPAGVRKIILATNIAETSITIDDVVFVLDSGKFKEKSYDPATNVSCLLPAWVSKASARQRRGRAGRVQPGICFHLFSSLTLDTFIEHPLPELLRTPLEQVGLQVKAMRLGNIATFLGKAPSTPDPRAVENAVLMLTSLGALEREGPERLTPLGWHMAELPVHPGLGKMMIYGTIFRCIDPILTMAASLGFRSPFTVPLNKKEEADAMKRAFARGLCSDHVTALNAYEDWRAEPPHRKSTFCRTNFLSDSTLRMIQDMRQQFRMLLGDLGFLPRNSKGDIDWNRLNENSDNFPLVKGVLVAGLFPNVARVDVRKSRVQLMTGPDGKVSPFPSSVQQPKSDYMHRWLVYYEKMRSLDLYLMDSSVVAPVALSLFGGKLKHSPEDQRICVDEDWITFEVDDSTAAAIMSFREILDVQIALALDNPSKYAHDFPQERTVAMVRKILDEGERTGFFADGGFTMNSYGADGSSGDDDADDDLSFDEEGTDKAPSRRAPQAPRTSQSREPRTWREDSGNEARGRRGKDGNFRNARPGTQRHSSSYVSRTSNRNIDGQWR